MGAVIALVIVGLLVWGAWRAPTSPAMESPAPEGTTRAKRTVASVAPPPDDPLDPQMVKRAIEGEFSLELRNRICALCADGRLQDASCPRCGDGRPVGRVYVDVVDDQGRPFTHGEAWGLQTCDEGRGMFGNGELDLPAGPCSVRGMRHDGALVVRGPEVTFEVVAGEEDQVLVELPSSPWGGVGVSLARGPRGLVVTRALDGFAAQGAGLADGAVLISVGGVAVDPSDLDGTLDRLTGPAGTSVEVTWEGPDGPVTSTLDRRPVPGSALRLGEANPG